MPKYTDREKVSWYQTIEACGLAGASIFTTGMVWFICEAGTLNHSTDILNLVRLFGPVVVTSWLGRRILLSGKSRG